MDQNLANYIDTINALHERWTPHEDQVLVGRKLFKEDIRNIFIQCGRKWGKTEIILYFLWRWAQLNANSSCYYISPYFKQSKEIIWANKRIQNFGPKEWLLEGSSGQNSTELRLNFKNGSFIKLDGSDNWTAYDGVTPHMVVYEEFRDFRSEFHERMSPNLAVNNAPLIIIGTPPNREGQYTELVEEFKNSDDSFWFKAPSWRNPHISKEWLKRQKQKLIDRGEIDVWQREYGAEFVKGGSSSIFPMWSDSMIKTHNQILQELERDKSKLQYIVCADPGTASVTAVLFMAYNPYNSKVYLLDEIYCTDPKQNTVNNIGAQIISKLRKLNPRIEPEDWVSVCDEAASWFIAEMSDRFDFAFMPTQKHLNKKEQGLSLIKDSMLLNLFIVSDSCKKTVWEIENYVKDDKGKIPKEDDHQIDNIRYGLGISGYSLNSEVIVEPEIDRVARKNQRMIRIEQELTFNDSILKEYDIDYDL